MYARLSIAPDEHTPADPGEWVVGERRRDLRERDDEDEVVVHLVVVTLRARSRFTLVGPALGQLQIAGPGAV